MSFFIYTMLYAINDNDQKIAASPSNKATCSCCGGEVIAKCGKIKIWHWAHKSKAIDCNFEPETNWHLQWKSYADPERTEVKVKRNGMYKMADIMLANGIVVEAQHSPISVDEIQLRERFYKNMFWIFDCRESYNKGRMLFTFNIDNVTEPHSEYNPDSGRHEMLTGSIDYKWAGLYYDSCYWSYPKKTILFAKKPIYLDLGPFMFRVHSQYGENVIRGKHSSKQTMIDYISDLGRMDYSEYVKYKFQ